MKLMRRTILIWAGLVPRYGTSHWLHNWSYEHSETGPRPACGEKGGISTREDRSGTRNRIRSGRVTPDRAEAWNARGFLYASQGRMEQALSDFTQAVRLDPANATYLSNLGVASLESGKADQALVAFNKALEVGPQSTLALKHRGMAYRQLGKLQHALHDFNAAILLDGQDATIYADRAVVYALQQDYREEKQIWILLPI